MRSLIFRIVLGVNLFILIETNNILKLIWDFYTHTLFLKYISSCYLYFTSLFIRVRVYPSIPQQLVYSITIYYRLILRESDDLSCWNGRRFCLLRGQTVRSRHCLADSQATYWLPVRVSTHTHTCIACLGSRPHVLVMHARKHDVYDTIAFSMHLTIDNWLHAR